MALPAGFKQLEATDDFVPAPGAEGIAPSEQPAQSSTQPMSFMEAIGTGGFSGSLGGTQPLLAKQLALASGASDEDAELVRQTMIDKETQARTEHPGAYYPSLVLTSALGGRAVGALAKAGLRKFAPGVLTNLATKAAASPVAARLLEQGATAGLGSGVATAGQADWRSPLRAAGETALGTLGGAAVGVALPAWARSSAENFVELGRAAGPMASRAAQGIAGRLGSGAAELVGEAPPMASPAAPLARRAGPQMTAQQATEALGQYLPEGASARAVPFGAPTATGGGGARMPPGGGPRVTVEGMPGSGGSELAEAGRGVIDEIRQFQLLKKLAGAATPRSVGSAAEKAAPEWALNAAGAIKKDLAKIPMEKWGPYGEWLLEQGVITPGASKTTVARRLTDIMEKAAPTQKLEAATQPYNPVQFLQAMEERIAGMNEWEKEHIAPQLRKLMSNVTTQSGAGRTDKPLATLAEMSGLKSSIQGGINWKDPAAVQALNREKRRLAGTLREDIDQQAAAQLSPEDFQDYMQRKLNYGLAKELLPITKSAAAGEAGNAFLSPTAWGTGAAAAGVGSALTDVSALPLLVGGAFAGKMAKERGSSVVAPLLKSIGRSTSEGQRLTPAARKATRETLQGLLQELEDELHFRPEEP